MYGYGMFQAAAASADSLVLLFAAAVLGGMPRDVGIVDALGTIGTVGGAFLLVILSRHVKSPASLFNASILATGLSLIAFASLGNIVLAFVLSLVIGLLMAPCISLAPLVASAHLPRFLWSRAFSSLNKIGALGGAAGVAISALFMMSGELVMPDDTTLRLLFILLAAMAILGAIWNYFNRDTDRQAAGQVSGASEAAKMAPQARRGPMLLVSDQMKSYLVSVFVMFAGMGMSYSGVHSYMVSDLKAPLGLLMASFLGFRLFTYFASGPSGEGHARFFHIQVQSFAAMARALLVLALALMGLLAPAQVTLPIGLVIIALWGISQGILTVAGTQSVAEMKVPGYWGQSQALYYLVTNTGGILGVFVGGILATQVGFSVMFLVAALLTGVSALLLLRR